MEETASSDPSPEPSCDWRAHFAGRATPEHPAAQILAEHHVMRAVLNAMQSKGIGMRQGEPLDLEFWSDVVDFIGNFVHLCHRSKEEKHFYPRVVAAGLLPQSRTDAMAAEHDNARRLTVDLCEMASAGDWEGVMRVVAVYVHLMEPHMRHEEEDLLQPALRSLDAGLAAELGAAFRAEEESALDARGLAGVLELAQRLCRRAGVDDLDANAG